MKLKKYYIYQILICFLSVIITTLIYSFIKGTNNEIFGKILMLSFGSATIFTLISIIINFPIILFKNKFALNFSLIIWICLLSIPFWELIKNYRNIYTIEIIVSIIVIISQILYLKLININSLNKNNTPIKFSEKVTKK